MLPCLFLGSRVLPVQAAPSSSLPAQTAGFSGQGPSRSMSLHDWGRFTFLGAHGPARQSKMRPQKARSHNRSVAELGCAGSCWPPIQSLGLLCLLQHLYWGGWCGFPPQPHGQPCLLDRLPHVALGLGACPQQSAGWLLPTGPGD